MFLYWSKLITCFSPLDITQWINEASYISRILVVIFTKHDDSVEANTAGIEVNSAYSPLGESSSISNHASKSQRLYTGYVLQTIDQSINQSIMSSLGCRSEIKTQQRRKISWMD